MPDITQTCRITGKLFVITEEDQKFYEKMGVPLPTLCPQERQRRRHTFRNERNLYQSTCHNCKKSIISMYSPDKEYLVYCPDCWWSDNFDPLVYGQDFDFTKSFFEQFLVLEKKVPHLALDVVNNENSNYVNLCGYSKDCYLIFAAEYDERCLYGTQIIKCNDCIDGLNCLNSQYCYDVLNIDGCYELLFGTDCYQCSNSMFLWNCRSCKECLFCSNVSNKKYCIFNKQYSSEEYKIKKQEILQMLQEGN